MERFNKVTKLDEEEIAQYEEDAGYYEYYAGMTREEAEKEAMDKIKEKRNETR